MSERGRTDLTTIILKIDHTHRQRAVGIIQGASLETFRIADAMGLGPCGVRFRDRAAKVLYLHLCRRTRITDGLAPPEEDSKNDQH